MFASTRDGGIILGKRLAENLDAGLGRKVVYTLTDKNGEIVQEAARVSGIVRTGAPSVDAGLCLLPIDSLREVLGYAARRGHPGGGVPRRPSQGRRGRRPPRRRRFGTAGLGACPGISFSPSWRASSP